MDMWAILKNLDHEIISRGIAQDKCTSYVSKNDSSNSDQHLKPNDRKVIEGSANNIGICVKWQD